MKKVVVKEGQGIFDISLQEYGVNEACWLIVEDNKEIETIDSDLYPGQIILIREADPLKEVATSVSLQNAGGVSTVGNLENKPGDFNSDYNDDYLN